MPSRRHVLRTVGSGIAVGLAGCAGLDVDGSGSADGTPDSGSPSGSATASGDRLALPSVVARGDLPDGRVTLRPEGTPTLLNFFTTWCGPCKEEMPDLRRLRAEYDRSEFHMVSITPETDEQLVRDFWSRYEATWPVVIDTGLAATERWDADSYPTNLLFDRDGEPASGDDPEIRARTFQGFDARVAQLVGEGDG